MNPQELADQITQQSQSNLALAFVSMPQAKRNDITLFYAFCRVVDDIADSHELLPPQKQEQLDTWKRSLEAPCTGEHPLAPSIRNLILDYSIPTELFREILAGVEMDVRGTRFSTFEELRVYCFRVASAVGLISIEIFGCKDPLCKQYAETLGIALQLTNILRDIHQDYQNGQRVYLPLEDLELFGLTANDLQGAQHDQRFAALMQFEAKRAFEFYEKAESLVPEKERKNLLPAEIMRRVYKRLLCRMQKDGFRVFKRPYRLSSAEKLLIVLGSILRGFFRRPSP